MTTTSVAHVATTHEPASGAFDWEELAARETNGLIVRLIWSRTKDRLRVDVVDQRFDEQFGFDVPGADALDAFNHPFAYAGGSSDLQPQG